MAMAVARKRLGTTEPQAPAHGSEEKKPHVHGETAPALSAIERSDRSTTQDGIPPRVQPRRTFVAILRGRFRRVTWGLLFLTTVVGLRFGRPTSFSRRPSPFAAWSGISFASPYWQEQSLFGITISSGDRKHGELPRFFWAGSRGREPSCSRRKSRKCCNSPGRSADQAAEQALFPRRLAQMLGAAARNGRQVALLLFDIDGFKAVTTRWGTRQGTACFQEIAERVGRRVRQADTFARVGGDEFVILMEIAHDRSDAIPVAGR